MTLSPVLRNEKRPLEAHRYKNLRLASNIPGVAVDGSNRATDLDLEMSIPAWSARPAGGDCAGAQAGMVEAATYRLKDRRASPG